MHPPQVASVVLGAAVLAVLAAAPAGGVRGQDADAPPLAPEMLEIDVARGEVRIPCRFVNPTELLEVFACHEDGPVHETVVAFSARGGAICAALREIGLRPASFWNATGPHDFLENQGDRVLVLLRWETDGRVREYPAEAVLDDGDTGFPSFVRGFSFGARDRAAGEEAAREEEAGAEREAGEIPADSAAPRVDPDDRQAGPAERPTAQESLRGGDAGGPAAVVGCGDTPAAVEISLGATSRQRPSYSLLSHPTHSRRWRPWVLPPVLDRDVVRELDALVAERRPARLVLRRVESEADVLAADAEAALRRGDRGRSRLVDGLLATAREIDRLKAQYVALAVELEAAVAAGSGEPLPPAELASRQRHVVELLGRGRDLSASLGELYWRLWARQEEYKLAWIASRGELALEVREQAETFTRYGPVLEARIVAEEAALQRLARAQREGAGDPAAVATACKRVERLEAERALGLARANLAYFERRLAEAPDDYVRGLFLEDIALARAQLLTTTGHDRLLTAELQELATGTGADAALSATLAAAKERAGVEIQLGALAKEHAELLVDRRWLRNDVDAEREPGKRTALATNLAGIEERLATLEAQIAKLRRRLEPAPGEN